MDNFDSAPYRPSVPPDVHQDSTHGSVNFEEVVHASSDIVLVVDRNLVAQYISPSCYRILGWKSRDFIGRGPEWVVHHDDLATIMSANSRKLKGDSSPGVETIRMRHTDGRWVWMEGNATPIGKGSEEFAGLVISLRDIHSRKIAELELRTAAFTDRLTGIANRRGFEIRFEQAWREMQKTMSTVALAVVDIDRFKTINDRLGHVSGDTYLRFVAQAIAAELSETDGFCSRHGGDEFLALFSNVEIPQAQVLGERLIASIGELTATALNEPLSVSVGIAVTSKHRHSAQSLRTDLLMAADSALYQSKRSGRGRATICEL